MCVRTWKTIRIKTETEPGERRRRRYLQPLLGLLPALHGQHQRVRALRRDLQLVLLLLAVLRDVGDAAALQRQLHLRLLVLGAFVALQPTGHAEGGSPGRRSRAPRPCAPEPGASARHRGL